MQVGLRARARTSFVGGRESTLGGQQSMSVTEASVIISSPLLTETLGVAITGIDCRSFVRSPVPSLGVPNRRNFSPSFLPPTPPPHPIGSMLRTPSLLSVRLSLTEVEPRTNYAIPAVRSSDCLRIESGENFHASNRNSRRRERGRERTH